MKTKHETGSRKQEAGSRNNTLRLTPFDSAQGRPYALRHCFTLIELLAVVAVIAILVGLLFPTVGYAKRQAKKARARTEMNNLKVAFVAFKNEYGYWPVNTSWTQMTSMLNGNVHPATGAAGSSWGVTNNPHYTKFIDVKVADYYHLGNVSATAEFIDPWGGVYFCLMDHGGGAVGKAAWTDSTMEDGQVNNPAGGNAIQAQIAVYSTGPDKTDNNGNSTTADDVNSWEN